MPDGDEEAFMQRFELGDLPGIGPKSRARLERLGLRTVRDALSYDVAGLTRVLGEREAGWLWARIHGVDESKVAERDVAKSISREETFAQDLMSDDELHEELLRLVTRVASDLREQELATRTVTVKLRDADFKTRLASRTLTEPVIADRVIFATARALLEKLRGARRTHARLLGVALSSLVEVGSESQLSLFETAPQSLETPKDRALASAVDKLRAKFGAKAIVPGSLTKPS